MLVASVSQPRCSLETKIEKLKCQSWGAAVRRLKLKHWLEHTPSSPPPFCLSSLYKCRYLSPLPAPWLASYRTCSAVCRDFRRIKLLGIVGSFYSSLLFSIFNILPPQPSPFWVCSHLCAGEVWGYLHPWNFFFPLLFWLPAASQGIIFSSRGCTSRLTHAIDDVDDTW